MRLKLRLGALVLAGGAAGLLAVGVPALASSHPASVRTVTGPEIIRGVLHGKAANAVFLNFRLTFQGLVYANSVKLSLLGPSAQRTLSTPAGKITIQINGQPQVILQANLRTCQAKFTQRQGITVIGSKSTRVFAGASGPGAFQVYRTTYFGRFTSGPNKGQCNRKVRLNKGAISSVLIGMVLTVRK